MSEKMKAAYMTMEASLVFPFLMGGIIFMIYLGCYFYNISIIKQVSHIAAIRGSQQINLSKKETEYFTERQTQELLKGKILMKKSLEHNAEVIMQKVKVTIVIEMEVPFMEGIPFIKEFWKIKTKAEARMADPIGVIRGVKKVDEYQISE